MWGASNPVRGMAPASPGSSPVQALPARDEAVGPSEERHGLLAHARNLLDQHVADESGFVALSRAACDCALDMLANGDARGNEATVAALLGLYAEQLRLAARGDAAREGEDDGRFSRLEGFAGASGHAELERQLRGVLDARPRLATRDRAEALMALCREARELDFPDGEAFLGRVNALLDPREVDDDVIVEVGRAAGEYANAMLTRQEAQGRELTVAGLLKLYADRIARFESFVSYAAQRAMRYEIESCLRLIVVPFDPEGGPSRAEDFTMAMLQGMRIVIDVSRQLDFLSWPGYELSAFIRNRRDVAEDEIQAMQELLDNAPEARTLEVIDTIIDFCFSILPRHGVVLESDHGRLAWLAGVVRALGGDALHQRMAERYLKECDRYWSLDIPTPPIGPTALDALMSRHAGASMNWRQINMRDQAMAWAREIDDAEARRPVGDGIAHTIIWFAPPPPDVALLFLRQIAAFDLSPERRRDLLRLVVLECNTDEWPALRPPEELNELAAVTLSLDGDRAAKGVRGKLVGYCKDLQPFAPWLLQARQRLFDAAGEAHVATSWGRGAQAVLTAHPLRMPGAVSQLISAYASPLGFGDYAGIMSAGAQVSPAIAATARPARASGSTSSSSSTASSGSSAGSSSRSGGRMPAAPVTATRAAPSTESSFTRLWRRLRIGLK